MDELKEYYTPLCIEVLKLIEGHRHYVLTQKREDRVDAVAEKRLALLARVEDEVLDCARVRKRIADIERKERKEFFKNRIKVYCDDCDRERPVEIIGEYRNKEIDVLCDLVRCTVCGHEIRNFLPNNRPDMQKFYEYIEEQSTILFRENKARLKKASDKDIFINLGLRAKAFLLKQELNKKLDEDLRENQKLADEETILFRDYLLKTASWDMDWDALEDILNDDEEPED
jgi:hypothetical protein